MGHCREHNTQTTPFPSMSASTPLKPGDVIPSFTCGLVNPDGKDARVWSSAELTNSYTIFFFFPMTSAVDASEVSALGEIVEDLRQMDCMVYGITSESVLSIMNWITKSSEAGGFGGSTKFKILSDRDLGICKQFGVKRQSGLPCRATFIIDDQNRIRHCNIPTRYMGRNIAELREIIDA